jgi:hypothetical protein
VREGQAQPTRAGRGILTARFHVSENTAIAQVVSRLTETFTPTVPGPQVRETVQRIHHRFDDSKVRDFVPLLVENAARNELRGRAIASRAASRHHAPQHRRIAARA